MKHYHTNQGYDDYRVPPALETEFYQEFPNKATQNQHLLDRGKWLSRASEVMYDHELSKLHSPYKAESLEDIIYQIFKDYLEENYLPADFILVVWDLVTKCQCNRVFEDNRSKTPMSTPKKSDLPKAAMRKVLTDAMDTMNPLVVKTLATAGPEYLKVRAAEAFAANETQFALVLLAWSLVQNDPAVPENA